MAVLFVCGMMFPHIQLRCLDCSKYSVSPQQNHSLEGKYIKGLNIFSNAFFFLTVSWAQDLVVFQPSSVHGMEGSSVILRCSYNVTSVPKIGSYQWVKDPFLVVKNSSKELTERANFISDQDFLLMRKADLEIRDLKPSDSGLYRCVVNIHSLPETSGKGTELQVIRIGELMEHSK